MPSPAAALRRSPRHPPLPDDAFPRPKLRQRQRDAAQTVPRRCADAAPSPNVTSKRSENRLSAPPVAASDVIVLDDDEADAAPVEARAASFHVPVHSTGRAPAVAGETDEVAAWGAELQDRHRDLVKRGVAFAAEHAVFAEEEKGEGWLSLTPPGLDFAIGLQEREIDEELQKREEVRVAKKAVRERRGRERVGLMEKVLWDCLKQEREKNAGTVSSLVTDCGMSALVEKQRLQLGDQRAQIEDQRAALEQQLRDQADVIVEQGDMIAKQKKQIDDVRAAARMEKVMVSSTDEHVFKKKEKKIQRELARERKDKNELLDIVREQRDQLERLRQLARTGGRTDDVSKKRVERAPRKSDGLVAQRREQKKLLSDLIDYQGRDMAVPGKNDSEMRVPGYGCGKEDESSSGGRSISSAWVFGFAVLVPRWYQRGEA